MKRYLRITEYTWMVLAILCAGLTAYYFINKNTDNGTFSLLITLFAGVMYSLRRRFNRHLEREAKKHEEQSKNKG